MNNVKGFTNTQKIKEEAALWLLKIDEAALSKDEAIELNQWVSTSNVHRSVIMRMSQTWNDMDVLSAMRIAVEPKSSSSFDKIKGFIGNQIISTFYSNNGEPKQKHSLMFKLSTVSACLLVCVMFIGSMNNQDTLSQPSYYTTAIGEYKQHTLEDGSTLWLNSNSKVKVDYSDNYRRIALINGEAHFEVQKDASRPFEVYSMNRLVRAIGTAFSVHKSQGHVEVLVSEGTVELAIVDDVLLLKPDDFEASTNISPSKEENTQTNSNEPAKVSKYLGKLSAGQGMTISTSVSAKNDDNQVVYIDSGELARKLSWMNGKLVFAGETLEQVVTEISRHTSIKIDVPDPELRQLRIGGHFEAGETDKLFSILDSGFGIKVNKIDKNHVELLSKIEDIK
ncbi:FecR family protein [Colwelliaceae bacterium BS250]